MKFEYIQHERITLTGNSEEYRIELDKRFKYCAGVAIFGQTVDFPAIIGIKDSKEWLLNQIPFHFISANFPLQKKTNYIIPQSYPALGNIINVYFSCTAFAPIGAIEVSFFLTNEKPVDNEFDYIYHYENIAAWNQIADYEFPLSLDSIYKKIYGISGIIAAGGGFVMNQILFSLRDNVSTYLHRIAGEYLENFNLPVNDNFLPVNITNSKNLEGTLRVKGVPAVVAADICLIFQVENRKKVQSC